MEKELTLKLEEVGINNIDIVGGKNASLGEMIQHLSPMGINVPRGYVITVAAYQMFLEHNRLPDRIRELIMKTDFEDLGSLRKTGEEVRSLIAAGIFPTVLADQILLKYKALSEHYGQTETDVAVRSSATAEDLPDASFAGQQETFLNVRGNSSILVAVRNCFASLFTDRAISYRHSFGYGQFEVGLSICIQKMVRSDIGVSGVAFSLDPESGFRNAVVINGSYGLGELLVQGAVSPDEFIVFKPTMKLGFQPIIEKKLGTKKQTMVYGEDQAERVKVINTEASLQQCFCLSDEMIILLAQWVQKIEDYYSNLKNKWTPMDIEWAVDGNDSNLYILQARPETIHSLRKPEKITSYSFSGNPDSRALITQGIAVGDKVGMGKVRIVVSGGAFSQSDAGFSDGDVLVTDITDPDWEPLMKRASAIVTNKGGRTCHAAIIARELGIPAIVGCEHATKLLVDQQMVTVSCAEGETGFVYDGEVTFEKSEFDLEDLPKINTPIMLNVASPALAFQFSQLPNNGVGLAREEFIINNYIKVHPLALLGHQKIGDNDLSGKIKEMICGYQDETDFFVSKLSSGIAKIAASFYPKPVIVRFSDFKSNEYFNLLGGKYFEPKEENPMLGWRGASRYYAASYKPAFALECEAIKMVREKMGLDNVIVMVPFCRTIDELLKVQSVMGDCGLKRGENGLQVYLMAEIPSNIILADGFAKYIDGFSIGSNDLTQLTLGLDRDSSLVAHIYDERNEAVKAMIIHLISAAKRNNVKVGICGQGPSDFPDFADFLVQQGIDTISVTPDSVIKTVQAIAAAEQRIC